MSRENSLLPIRKTLRQGLVATCVALCLLFLTTVAVFANSVYISDSSHVLNASRVRSEAASLSKPISVYAINYSGTDSAFDKQAVNSITSSNMIVLAFNSHHIAIVGGRSVGLSNSQYGDARDAFTNSYKNNQDFTTATIAAIDSLRNSLNGGGFMSGVGGGSGFSIGGTLCCLALIIVLVVGLFAFARRRGSRPGFFNRRAGWQDPYNQYNQGQPYGPGPYNQGSYPPGYQGPYPPQNQGMNPWAAGGLGAAAGGFLGYELGRDAGERERDRERDYDNNGGYGDQGGFGGGASGDFGGGDQGGFGGDQGGFGGGASGDFGGGDQGGFGGDQGGNNDFGGGSSGDF